MDTIFKPCFTAISRSSGKRAMVPSSFIISTITPAGSNPAKRAKSTAASVWPTRRLHAFEQKTNHQVHIALTTGEWTDEETVPVRIQSAGVANDIFHLLTSNESSQLEKALKAISQRGKGAVIYMNQEPNGERLLNRIRSFNKGNTGQKSSFSKDARDFGVGAQIIRFLGIKHIDLLTNNPIKRIGVSGYGLEIVQNSPLD